jgi:hypothetical protein
MKSILLTLPLLIVFLYGCSNSTSNAELRANAMCDCVKDAVDLSSLTAINIEDKFDDIDKNADKQVKFSKCIFGVFEEMTKDLDNLKQEEKKAYTKTLLKAGIDCDCSDKLMDLIPFDLLKISLPMMKSELERTISRNQERARESAEESIIDSSYPDEMNDLSSDDLDEYQKEIDEAVKEAERAMEELNKGY